MTTNMNARYYKVDADSVETMRPIFGDRKVFHFTEIDALSAQHDINLYLYVHPSFETKHSGMQIIRKAKADGIRSRVFLTRKTTKDGDIKHAVVIENKGRFVRLNSFNGIGEAYKLYKTMVTA